MALVDERTFRHTLFVALLFGAPAVLYLVQVVFVVPPVLLLAGAVGMLAKFVATGFGRESLFMLVALLAGALICAGPCFLLAWLLGKLAARLPAGWPRWALLGALLAGLVWITQQPIYGGGGHGPGKFGSLQSLLGGLDESFGKGTVLTVYLVSVVLVLLPVARAYRRARREARASADP
jgi:hypothetical protein